MILSTQPSLPPVEEDNPIFNRRRLTSIVDYTQFPTPSPLSPSFRITIPFDSFIVRDVFAEVLAPSDAEGQWWSMYMLIERDTTTAIKRDT